MACMGTITSRATTWRTRTSSTWIGRLDGCSDQWNGWSIRTSSRSGMRGESRRASSHSAGAMASPGTARSFARELGNADGWNFLVRLLGPADFLVDELAPGEAFTGVVPVGDAVLS